MFSSISMRTGKSCRARKGHKGDADYKIKLYTVLRAAPNEAPKRKPKKKVETRRACPRQMGGLERVVAARFVEGAAGEPGHHQYKLFVELKIEYDD